MTVQIRTLDGAGVTAASDVLVASHAHYPPFAAVFPDAEQRKRALRSFFAATIRDAVSAGAVDAAVEHDIQGVAVWLPPGGFPWTAARKLHAAPTLMRIALAAPRSLRRFAQLGTNAEGRHPEGQHWYLVVMGVRPDRHGQQIGSELLEHGLRRVDDDEQACYLETGDPRNVAFYRRFGFRVTDPNLLLVPGGPPHVRLRRATSG
jgi:ribosomal protein S18 acetylase RimI-like enzyme